MKHLYDKNSLPMLKKQLFENPTLEYRGVPFWALNRSLDDHELLDRQMSYLKEMGFGGVLLHSRSGMNSAYMGKEFMDAIRFCVDKGIEKDLPAWLYDEDRWPSGFGGGYITRDFKNRTKRLVLTPNEPVDDVTREQFYKVGGKYFLSSYDIELSDRNELVSYKRIERLDNATNKYYAYIEIAEKSAWFNGGAYGDIMDEEFTESFIKVTHDKYFSELSHEQWSAIPAIFTDEPQYYRSGCVDEDCLYLPWTRLSEEKFFERYNYDVLDVLPAVMFKGAGEKLSIHRLRYYELITELLATSFVDKCAKWCDDHNIRLTGHAMREYPMRAQTSQTGEAMRMYRSMHIPGIDMLNNDTELVTAKQCQSVVHQYGREAMLSELYGTTGWDFDFCGHKYQGDWQAALGVTVRVHHLAMLSMAGEGKRDYPASINYQSPWWREYRYIEDHFARIATALTRGKPIVSIAVIHPIESYWGVTDAQCCDTTLSARLDKNFCNLCKELLENHLDFDYVSEALLTELIIPKQPLSVGAMQYEVIVVADCVTLRSSTISFLKSFAQHGGTVVCVGDAPEYADGKKQENILDGVAKSVTDTDALIELLEHYRTVSVTNTDGTQSNDLIYNFRNDDSCKWLFLAHSKEPKSKIETESKEITVTVKGEFDVEEYRTLDGDISKLSVCVADGYTSISKTLYPYDSLLLCFKVATHTGECDKKADDSPTANGDPLMADRLVFKREEPNVLVLDMAEYALDDGEYASQEEILRLDNILRASLGWELMTSSQAQPWAIEDKPCTHMLRLRFKICCEEAIEDVSLAIEQADEIKAILNGKEIPLITSGYFVDEAISVCPIGSLKKGDNILEIISHYEEKRSLEWCYLLGEFDVTVQGQKRTLQKKRAYVEYGSLVDQGMPFYGGNAIYSFDVITERDGRISVSLPKYAGALAKVSFDYDKEQYAAFPPRSVTSKILQAGRHTVSIKVFGNRYNSFGALHHTDRKKVKRYGPPTWRTVGKWWTYEYRPEPLGLLEKPLVTFKD